MVADLEAWAAYSYICSISKGKEFHSVQRRSYNVDSLFFALDHPKYARWLPIHVRNVLSLDNIAPKLPQNLRRVTFFVHKTHSAFSSLAIGHAHEQNNKLVKSEGGVIGLTESTPQLLR